MNSTLRDRLQRGDVVLGLANTYPAAGIIEGMCRGWDLVWIDAQHGEMTLASAAAAVRAAAGMGIETLLRVPGHEPGVIGPLVDLAPSAVMAPMVNTAAEAGRIVEALRFPPLGERSYGGRRAIDLAGRDYFKSAEPMVVAQIETPEGVDNAGDVAATEGVDMLFFGPDDMKLRMGLPMETPVTGNEQLRGMMKRTAGAAREANKLAGTVAATPDAARLAIELGYRLLIGGGDITFLRTAAPARLAELRAAVSPQS